LQPFSKRSIQAAADERGNFEELVGVPNSTQGSWLMSSFGSAIERYFSLKEMDGRCQNFFAAPLSYRQGSAAMDPKNDRKELERRLEQARRMVRDHDDPLTKERLSKLIRNLEEQLQ
jgi:hypothetical protein